jgi:hypothetical protein
MEDAAVAFSGDVPEFGGFRWIVRGCFEEDGLDELVANVELVVWNEFLHIERRDWLLLYRP